VISKDQSLTNGIIIHNGNVGIGTTSVDFKLTVNGKIKSEGLVTVLDVPAADYVFDPSYQLMSLAQVQKYINEHRHLPNMPSAVDIKAHGWDVGQMSNKLLEKVEELTLHLIELKNANDLLQARIEMLEKNKD
jgi:hypothetical protein